METLNGVIVELSISAWTARKLDRNASREVKDNKNAASDDAARVNKNLLAGMDNLKRITDFTSITRGEFYKQTLPWSDLGQRLVPMTQFFELNTWLQTREAEFTRMVQQFLIDYPTLISAQAFQLGQLFNRSEYPTSDEIAAKFRFSYTFSPVPTAGDFRIDAPNEVMEELRVRYEAMVEQRVTEVNQDLWARLHTTLQHMSDRLGYSEDGKPKIFRDSLVDNAVELCDLLKRLNVTNDPELDKARAALESIMLGVEPDELRSPGVRDEIKSQVDEAIGAWFS